MFKGYHSYPSETQSKGQRDSCCYKLLSFFTTQLFYLERSKIVEIKPRVVNN